ncbi:hypothetical protein [Streptomyces sp. SID5789]|uniref:hypothetical protein n=1 Tax=Streptomyces sp. SID5789 TaxID=2690310 RepID=UPI00136D61F8|nr:hypothetical protein [Streptomyces sp. SID5789]MZE74670.1 hypothetical protein [Streptomyces sp. SID5789]
MTIDAADEEIVDAEVVEGGELARAAPNARPLVNAYSVLMLRSHHGCPCTQLGGLPQVLEELVECGGLLIGPAGDVGRLGHSLPRSVSYGQPG